MIKTRFVTFSLVLLTACTVAVAIAAHRTGWLLGEADPIVLDIGRLVSVFSDSRINESSGIVRSIKNKDCFWTHNDSGDSPRIFLVHQDGKTIASVTFKGAKAIDWEDIAIGNVDGIPKIIAGDIGGNAQKREDVLLYVIDEPEVSVDTDVSKPALELTAELDLSLHVTFAGGVTNYESIAYSPADRSVLIVEKAVLGGRLYSVPFPEQKNALATKRIPNNRSPARVDLFVEAKEIGFSPVPFATACDVSDDGRSMTVITYNIGFLFHRRDKSDGQFQSWSEAMQREPVSFPLPKLKQVEAVCFSADGRSVYLTSEHTPTPLVQLELPGVGSEE